ncbi:MAG: hypothetical protein Q6373_017450 [Candidatus Sigynarchaeota archaeon]
MYSTTNHLLDAIPETGTYHAGIASSVEKICANRTRLPSLALEIFPSAPYKRTGPITLPPWNNRQLVYLFFKAKFHGYEGVLVLIIQEGAMDALSIQLKRGAREVKIIEGEAFVVRDNQGFDLGSFESIPSVVAMLDRTLK